MFAGEAGEQARENFRSLLAFAVNRDQRASRRYCVQVNAG
jgi:hypothetical protein